MTIVSNLFKDYIYATERTMQAKVSFEMLENEAYTDASMTVSGEADISRLSQATNKIREMTRKYATFERDYFLLDGNSYIPPKENEGDSELAWWSDVISDENAVFTVPPYVEVTFTNPHSSVGLTFTFDTKANEFASDFLLEVFDASDALLTSETVTGNTNPIYYFETPIIGYKRLKLTIQKWATPNRRARLVEIDFGVIREYTSEKLISLKVIEEMDVLASTVPSNQIEFTLDNQDQTFNVLNPNGVSRFLKINQEMSAQIGLLIGEEKYEWINMGKFYLSEWMVEQGSLTSTFIGNDMFTKLDGATYTALLQNTNLYDLAVDVLTKAGITNYEIDETLKTITTVGFKEAMNTREALQMIAIAGKSLVRQDRNGAIILKHYDALTYETGYVTWTGQEYASATISPQVSVDYSFQGINFENAYDVPKVTLATPVTNIVITINDGSNEPPTIKYVNAGVTEGVGYEIDNPLINTSQHASDVANWMFIEYNSIAEYEANWRQNPALECGDVISIEDNFGTGRKSRITKQEFDFSGYLEGMTNAKGGI